MINHYIRNEPNITLEEFIEKANKKIKSSKTCYSKTHALLMPFYSDEKLLDEPLIPKSYIKQYFINFLLYRLYNHILIYKKVTFIYKHILKDK